MICIFYVELERDKDKNFILSMLHNNSTHNIVGERKIVRERKRQRKRSCGRMFLCWSEKEGEVEKEMHVSSSHLGTHNNQECEGDSTIRLIE